MFQWELFRLNTQPAAADILTALLPRVARHSTLITLAAVGCAGNLVGTVLGAFGGLLLVRYEVGRSRQLSTLNSSRCSFAHLD